MSPAPYADLAPVHRTLPDHGLPRDEVLAILRTMASTEDATWESGRCSGTMYCGDHDHYDFLNQAFALFSHVNVLQRDMCPSATRFESEIIAMTLDLLHAEAVEGTEPVGLVSSGGTGSICHAVLAYRDHASATRGVVRPNVIKPETAHPAFDKACHLFGVELRVAPVDPVTTRVDTAWVADAIDDADDRPGRIGLQLRLRDGRPDRGPLRHRARTRHRPPRRRLSGRMDPPLRPGARATTSRCSTSGCRASPRSRRTPTSTATP